MTYNELLAEREELNTQITALQAQLKSIDRKIEMASEEKAKGIFQSILNSLQEMSELGYTITAKTIDAEWGGENWHEMGISLRDLEMTSTNYPEAIAEILRPHFEKF